MTCKRRLVYSESIRCKRENGAKLLLEELYNNYWIFFQHCVPAVKNATINKNTLCRVPLLILELEARTRIIPEAPDIREKKIFLRKPTCISYLFLKQI